MFHSILVQAYYEANLIPLLKVLLFDGNFKEPAGLNLKTCVFFQSALPSDGRFLNVPFGTVFEYLLLNFGCLTIGLFRESSESGKRFEYVVLNPAADVLIREYDYIFAFGGNKPDWSKT